MEFYCFKHSFRQFHCSQLIFCKQIESCFLLFLDLGSSFWGMALILASTNLLTARIAAGCFALALFIVLFVAKNVSNI